MIGLVGPCQIQTLYMGCMCWSTPLAVVGLLGSLPPQAWFPPLAPNSSPGCYCTLVVLVAGCPSTCVFTNWVKITFKAKTVKATCQQQTKVRAEALRNYQEAKNQADLKWQVLQAREISKRQKQLQADEDTWNFQQRLVEEQAKLLNAQR